MSAEESLRRAEDLLGRLEETRVRLEGTEDPEAALELLGDLAEAIVAGAPELDMRITAAAEGWTADRLGAIERNVLRIAIHELDAGDVPDAVAIDEAVGLSKRYASDEAGRLVNGILGRIQRERAA